MTLENWRPIPGYEGLYLVSDIGRVWSLVSNRLLTPFMVKKYRRVNLVNNGVMKPHDIHRLVAAVFVRQPRQGLEVRHLDGDSLNNCVGNLRWGTHRENIEDRTRHGTHVNFKKTHCPQGHPYKGDNLYVTPKGTRKCRACQREYRLRREDTKTHG